MNVQTERNKCIAERVLKLLSNYRRHFPENCQHKCDIACYQSPVEKISHSIARGKSIVFVLPAFPAKSPNANKTAGILPDLGEKLALRFLDTLCQQIKAFYPPGATVIICSDGRVFNDLLHVEDHNVDFYTREIKNIIRTDCLDNLSTFHLDDSYRELSPREMREILTQKYAEPLNTIKRKVREVYAARVLFNGVHRFIFEDYLSILPTLSRNKIRTITKEITYNVIQRSNAWSQFIKNKFPDAVRLSIHPQLCGSDKLGIMLLKSKDNWATPWHRIVLYDGQDYLLTRKQDAENIKATPVFKDKKFSHYEINRGG
jgi:pyoverdine/dityrosine biosynthesis protein Dit1